jgi:hypothetical protein
MPLIYHAPMADLQEPAGCHHLIMVVDLRRRAWLVLSSAQDSGALAALVVLMCPAHTRSFSLWRLTQRSVRAENPVHGSDQQACHPSRLAVMITGHVSTVCLSPGHAGRHMAAAVPA